MARKGRKKCSVIDIRYINTPVKYTQLAGGLTLLQQDLLFKVSEHLQGYISKYFDEGRYKTDEIPRPLFTKDDIENMEPLVISFSEMGVSPTHYSEVEESIREALRIVAKARIADEDGRYVIRWMPVFSEAETLDKGAKGYEYKTGIKFRINPAIAAYSFDMSAGYVSHPNLIAQISNSDCTPLLYMLLKSLCLKGDRAIKAKITVMELKEYLGMIEYSDERDEQGRIMQRTPIGVSYPDYNKFRMNIINKAKKDLDRLGEEGLIDYTFDYKEVRNWGKTTGEPNYIEFKLVKTEFGKLRDASKYRLNSEPKLVTFLCDYCPDLKEREVKEIVRTVPDDIFSAFTIFAYSGLRETIEKKQPDDVATYIKGVLRNWIRQHRPQPKEQVLFQDAKEEPAPSEQPEEVDVVEEGRYADEWQQILSAATGEIAEIHKQVRLIGSLNDAVYVGINKSDYAKLQAVSYTKRRMFDAEIKRIIGYKGRIPIVYKEE